MAHILLLLSTFAGVIHSHLLAESPTGSTATDHQRNVTYHGLSSNGVDTFLNIPFGQNTGGTGRFAPPKPFISPHNSIVNATTTGFVCPQGGQFLGVNTNVNSNIISEDCLNLRISRPASIVPNAKLPVMAFIYSGGYEIGNIYDPLYTPDDLIHSAMENESPVIYVAMNYRTGSFGFASSDILGEKGMLNAGLRDQRLGLEWIQENIKIFGGDPDRVTMFGQSAGANSVALQVTAFGGVRGFPFQQAIMESGTLTLESGNQAFHNQNFADLSTKTGCTFIIPNSEETLDCLRSLSLERLLDADLAVAASNGMVMSGEEAFIPVVDGDFLPEVPSKLFQQGRYAKISMIAGWTQEDSTLFTSQNITTEHDGISFYENELFIPNRDTEDLFSLYHPLDFQPTGSANISPFFYQSTRIFRDIAFYYNTFFIRSEIASQSRYESKSRPYAALRHIFDRYMGSGSLKDVKSAPEVFLYELNQTALTPRLEAFGVPDLGVTHNSDIPYVFNEVSNPSLGLNNTESNRLLASQMSKSWASFATFGKSSIRGKGILQGWSPAFEHGTRESEARIFVIGGPNEGMSPIEGKTANDAVKSQNLAVRCGLITSPRFRKVLFD